MNCKYLSWRMAMGRDYTQTNSYSKEYTVLNYTVHVNLLETERAGCAPDRLPLSLDPTVIICITCITCITCIL